MTGILEELKAIIALKMCDGIGNITANRLISSLGSAVAVFEEKSGHLSSICGVSEDISYKLKNNVPWELVEKEEEYILKNNINYITRTDRKYPKSLQYIDTPPLILFFTGELEKLNTLSCISIVGTRNATAYGTDMVSELLKELAGTDICIISGMAIGIDIAAHKYSVKNKIPTFGVVAHGLKTFYPAIHRRAADKLTESGGGIITEFFSDEIPNRENFPKRNRIIAGLSYATLVVEAAITGGALITADLAHQYKRRVFAVPGRYNDKYSEGCNKLIKSGKAFPVLSIPHLIEELGLQKKKKKALSQISHELSKEESDIFQIIRENNKIGLDSISEKSSLNISQCSSLLFGLEIKGMIRNLPGKLYELC